MNKKGKTVAICFGLIVAYMLFCIIREGYQESGPVSTVQNEAIATVKTKIQLHKPINEGEMLSTEVWLSVKNGDGYLDIFPDVRAAYEMKKFPQVSVTYTVTTYHYRTGKFLRREVSLDRWSPIKSNTN